MPHARAGDGVLRLRRERHDGGGRLIHRVVGEAAAGTAEPGWESPLRFEAWDAPDAGAKREALWARAVADADHRILGAVHIGHLLAIVARKGDLAGCGFNPHLLARLEVSAYREYRRRLHVFVRESRPPLLVFCSSEYEPSAPEWVRKVRPTGVTAFLETPPDNPKPLLAGVPGTEERWSWLTARLERSGVKSIALVGEAAFTQDNGRERRGCVWEAWHHLGKRFETEILHDLTYPGIDVPGPSRPRPLRAS